MKIADEDKLKIPTASRMERLTELLKEDEDFRFQTLKLNRNKKPRFELPEPTKDDRDNIESSPTFKAVVLVARPNFYASDEDKEKGREPKEKRVLYILRPGKITPERIFISPTGLRNWKGFCLACSKQGTKFYQVMCEFSAEHVDPPKSEFAWNRPKFNIDRHLTEEEIEHVMDVRTLVDERVKVYEDESELDKAEAEQLGIKRDQDDDEDADKHSKKRRRDLEEDDEEDDDKGKKGKPGSGKSKKEDPKKSKSKKSDDDDDEDEPKKKKSKKSDDDDDEDDDKAKKKSSGKSGYPDIDDDDDEDLDATKKKKSKAKDDDDDDEDEPKKKKSKKSDDDDDDDDEDKGKKKKKTLDDDDEDED